MSARRRQRRSPGEGSVWPYKLKSGAERWSIGYVRTMPDGTRKSVTRRGYLTKQAAQKAVRDVLTAADKGELVDPSRQPLGAYLEEWLDGLRTDAATTASYRKNVRLHIKPYLGAVPLASLTTVQIDKLYRDLERSGRRDWKGGGLSPRTVRYVHTILHKALGAAVKSKRLASNPSADAEPPTATQAEAAKPEMHPWDAQQLRAFLAWSAEHTDLDAAWHVLAMTGMRRGELLALRWRDVDLDAATIRVRRSAGVVRNLGQGGTIVEGDTKTHKPRVIDIGTGTVALLRSHKSERGLVHLSHARADALVFGDHEGEIRHPERFSRRFKADLRRCRHELGEDVLHDIRLHDLRHTHASLLLADGEPLKTVSERLGHANATITLSVYAHVMPGNQRSAANRFEALVGGATS